MTGALDFQPVVEQLDTGVAPPIGYERRIATRSEPARVALATAERRSRPLERAQAKSGR